MKIWMVMESDYEASWVVAVYDTKELADQHVAALGGSVAEDEVLTALHPDVTDPEKIANYVRECEECREQNIAYQATMEAQSKARAEVRPNPPHMNLCHCKTFSTSTHFINDHGYCGYCGGFTPSVFREHMGEDALYLHIEKLAIHDREKMREIVKRESSTDSL